MPILQVYAGQAFTLVHADEKAVGRWYLDGQVLRLDNADGHVGSALVVSECWECVMESFLTVFKMTVSFTVTTRRL